MTVISACLMPVLPVTIQNDTVLAWWDKVAHADIVSGTAFDCCRSINRFGVEELIGEEKP